MTDHLTPEERLARYRESIARMAERERMRRHTQESDGTGGHTTVVTADRPASRRASRSQQSTASSGTARTPSTARAPDRLLLERKRIRLLVRLRASESALQQLRRKRSYYDQAMARGRLTQEAYGRAVAELVREAHKLLKEIEGTRRQLGAIEEQIRSYDDQ